MFTNPYRIDKFKTCYFISTYSCNNRCVWCYADYYRREKLPLMDFSLAKSAIKLLSDLGMDRVILIGGEPTTYPHIFELINMISQNKLKPRMVTNGRRLSNIEFVRKLKQAGIGRIAISIQGADPVLHNKTSGAKDAFSETIQGIKNCIQENIQVQTSTVIGDEDIEKYKRLMDMLCNLGVKHISLNSCVPTLKSDNSYEGLLRPIKQAQLIEELYRYGKKPEIKLYFVFRLPLCLITQDMREEMVKENILINECNVYEGDAFALNPDGTILPCSHWMGYPLMNIIKNKKTNEVISSKDFIKIWNSKKPLRLRKAIWRYRSEKCIGCKYWGKYCSAGCPLFWYKFNPEEEIVGIS